IVQRERERMAFRSAEYWDIAARLDAGGEADSANPRVFSARLVDVDGSRVATGRDFGSDGRLKADSRALVLDEARARRLAEALH
ncbi:hypothetical protein, partial [Nocardia farcinica]